MSKIGFIGASGLMGHGMAKNLLAKGHAMAITVHNNRERVADLLAAGAVEARSPAALAASCDIVFVCVTGSPQVESVVAGPEGLMAGAKRGLTIVDCSTSEPDSTTRLRERCAALGVALVDAPLARSPVEAEAGRLNVMVGADDEIFDRLAPVLRAFAENVIHVGGPGSGHIIKLLNNLAASFVLDARRNQKGLGSLEEQRLLTGGYTFRELEKLADTERDTESRGQEKGSKRQNGGVRGACRDEIAHRPVVEERTPKIETRRCTEPVEILRADRSIQAQPRSGLSLGRGTGVGRKREVDEVSGCEPRQDQRRG